MGIRTAFTPEKLIIGVLSQHRSLPLQLVTGLEEPFGPVERVDGPFPFDYTHYYDDEMGPGLLKHFVVFRDLVDPSGLAGIKIFTNQLEQMHAGSDGRRQINLDPGLLSAGRFILATTKDRGHRIPLSSGMYVEVTLIYSSREFQRLPWTYDDFSSDHYRALLKEIRRDYLNQLKNIER